jgi:hypothetical protein
MNRSESNDGLTQGLATDGGIVTVRLTPELLVGVMPNGPRTFLPMFQLETPRSPPGATARVHETLSKHTPWRMFRIEQLAVESIEDWRIDDILIDGRSQMGRSTAVIRPGEEFEVAAEYVGRDPAGSPFICGLIGTVLPKVSLDFVIDARLNA